MRKVRFDLLRSIVPNSLTRWRVMIEQSCNISLEPAVNFLTSLGQALDPGLIPGNRTCFF